MSPKTNLISSIGKLVEVVLQVQMKDHRVICSETGNKFGRNILIGSWYGCLQIRNVVLSCEKNTAQQELLLVLSS